MKLCLYASYFPLFSAIDYLLYNSGLNDSEAADRALLGEISEHWVSYLHTQLQNPTPGSLNTVSTSALFCILHSHPIGRTRSRQVQNLHWLLCGSDMRILVLFVTSLIWHIHTGPNLQSQRLRNP